MADEPKSTPAARRTPIAARPDDTAQRPDPGRMIVVGRVLDPQGKPVPDATAMVYAALKHPGVATGSGRWHRTRSARRQATARAGSGSTPPHLVIDAL